MREATIPTAAKPYTRIKMGSSINVGVTALRNIPTSGDWTISIDTIIVTKPPSIRADEASFEVYCSLLTGYT